MKRLKYIATGIAIFVVIGAVLETMATFDPVLGAEWGGVIGLCMTLAIPEPESAA